MFTDMDSTPDGPDMTGGLYPSAFQLKDTHLMETLNFKVPETGTLQMEATVKETYTTG